MPPQNRNNPGSSSHLGREAAVGAAMSRLSRRKRNADGPPPVMTWGKALPIIVVAFTFDLIRIFFEWFWFLGPALGALACTTGVNSAVGVSTGGLVGNTVATVCTAGAVALGAVFSESTIAFGVIMADAVALIGWLTIGLWAFTTNQRMFKENGEDAMHVVLPYLSILISFIPIIGTAPTVGWITYRFFKFQIKIEKEALRRYEEEQATEQLQERQQQAQLMQAQAANDERFNQEQSANDENFNREQVEDDEQATETPTNVLRFPSERVRRTTLEETNPQSFKKAA